MPFGRGKLGFAKITEYVFLQGPLPLDPLLLGEKAMHCRAYAKALHYKEDEFNKGPTSQVIESLISINNKLQQKEAAAGKERLQLKLLEVRENNKCLLKFMKILRRS